MTPNVALVQIESPHWRGLRLWLPLFLLWIPLILLSPLILLVLLAVSILGQVNTFHAIATFWGIVCSLPGTEVTVHADGNNIRVKIL